MIRRGSDVRAMRGCTRTATFLVIAGSFLPAGVAGQVPVAAPADSTTAQEGIYDRPFITTVAGTSVGGYLESRSNWFVEEGVGEGLSLELRRFNIFLFSQVSSRVRFLSELEFEHGTEEIELETALVDVELAPAFSLRAGVILPPLGYLNQNHDSPKWEFVDRPLVTTEIIPSTLSEVGFGAFGQVVRGGLIWSYDAYLTNGLGDAVVGNETGRTHIPSGKSGEAFGEDNNGSPAVSARLAARRPGRGEVGISYYGGYYNTFRMEGVEVDERRWLRIAALDVGIELGPVDVRGEFAHAAVDVPPGLVELFGSRQWGGHVDVVVPLWQPRIAEYPDAVLAGAIRVEYVDFNRGRFSSTGDDIGDDVTAVVMGLSARPTEATVFRLNLRLQRTRDFVGNPAARGAGIQVGLATYF